MYVAYTGSASITYLSSCVVSKETWELSTQSHDHKTVDERWQLAGKQDACRRRGAVERSGRKRAAASAARLCFALLRYHRIVHSLAIQETCVVCGRAVGGARPPAGEYVVIVASVFGDASRRLPFDPRPRQNSRIERRCGNLEHR